jgi:serine/threonine protein kinase
MSSINSSDENKVDTDKKYQKLSFGALARGRYYFSPLTEESRIRNLYRFIRDSAFVLGQNMGLISPSSYNGEYIANYQQWRKTIVAELQSASTVDEILAILTNLEWFDRKSSTSSTIILFSTAHSKNQEQNFPFLNSLSDVDRKDFASVAIKVSFEPTKDNALATTLETERAIVRELFTLMYEHNYCNNITAYLGWKTIDPRQVMLHSFQPHYADHEISLESASSSIFKSGYKPEIAHFLVLEYGNGGSLDDLFADHHDFKKYIPENELVCILTQLYWTLSVFYRLGLRHNDLHLGNIILKALTKAETFTYVIDEDAGEKSAESLTLMTKYLVKIYDCDRASVYFPGVPRNTQLDVSLCPQRMDCNGIPNKDDVAWLNFRIASFLQKHKEHYPSIWKFLMATLGGEDNYNSVFSVIWSKGWDTVMKKKNLLTRIHEDSKLQQSILNPFQCMKFVWSHFHIPITKNVDVSATMKKANYFHLPKQIVLKTDYPEKSFLRSDHYQNVTTPFPLNKLFSTVNRKLSPVSLEEFRKHLYFLEFENNESKTSKEDGIMLQLWVNELKMDHNEGEIKKFDWANAAWDLYMKFHSEFLQYTEHKQFINATFMLTCPMYYGLTRLMEKQILNDLNNAEPENPTIVKRMELLIWNRFNNVLPVQIPLLYNLGQTK